MTTVQILRSWWRARYPVYTLGLAVGLAMMWLPFKTFQDNDAWGRRLRVDGVPAQAVVDELVHKRRNTMHLRYESAGGQRQAEVGCWEVCLPADSAVQIWVNPKDPGDFVTDFGVLSGHRGRPQGVVGAAGLVLSGWMALAVVARGYERRRDRRRHDWQRQQRDQRQGQFVKARAGTKRKPSRPHYGQQ
ncbi:DUF3592 domain-containing protein [Micromonospora saelicesensis]|uniref:DUF3592 domain-containing protein n=1 Tax=Micromonospora saelicesensis TaxID=285676 RepID=A0A1C4ZNN3_9ACTN|nr:DUF3592 domain-containing protein [Micromonospora saelicesensis]SCF34499.1 hypothetical protein GA0070561_5605 [Micromonospora saelicesensis]